MRDILVDIRRNAGAVSPALLFVVIETLFLRRKVLIDDLVAAAHALFTAGARIVRVRSTHGVVEGAGGQGEKQP